MIKQAAAALGQQVASKQVAGADALGCYVSACQCTVSARGSLSHYACSTSRSLHGNVPGSAGFGFDFS